MGGYIQDVSGAAPLPTFPTSGAPAAPGAVAPAAPAAPWTGKDYMDAATTAGEVGVGGYMSRAPLAAAAKGAWSLAQKIPGVGMLPKAGPVALLAAAPAIGQAAGGGLAGAVQTFTNPIGPGARDWAADTQANANAEGLARLSAGAYALGHAAVNAVRGAGYGVQAAFAGDPQAAAAAAAPGVATLSAAAHPAADYFRMAHDDFVKHLGGLTNAEGQALLAHMSQMPRSTPQDQIMNQVSQAHTAKYMSDMANADKEPDVNKRGLLKQKALGEFTQAQRYLITGAGSLPYELGKSTN